MAILAAFDVDIANEYGIPAALIFHEVLHLCRKSRREDGFCWKTTEEFKEDLALGERQIRDAIKILTSAGIMETKNTYIAGTMKKCRHFRITDDGLRQVKNISYDKSDVYKMYKSEEDKTYKSTNTQSTIRVVNKSSKQYTDSTLDAFEEAWSHMPKKAGKEPARRHFLKAVKDGHSTADILKGAIAYERFCLATGREKRYTLNGSTWFSQRRWEDDLGDPASWGSKSGSQIVTDFSPDYTVEGW